MIDDVGMQLQENVIELLEPIGVCGNTVSKLVNYFVIAHGSRSISRVPKELLNAAKERLLVSHNFIHVRGEFVQAILGCKLQDREVVLT